MISTLIFATAIAFTTADWNTVVTRLQKAAPASNATELRAIREELARGERTAQVRYALAYNSRVLAFSAGTTLDERRSLLDDAAALLAENIAADPSDAESHALLGSVQGALIGVDRSRAPELAAKARESLASALRLAPHNPRVHLLLGTSAFHRPEEYGGGPRVAEPHLQRALELFRQEPKAKPWPNWGRFDTYMYLGQTFEKLQRRDEAATAYDAALAIAPDSQYVRRVLMPRVRR